MPNVMPGAAPGFCLRPESIKRKGWTYETAAAKLAGRASKKVANNTYLRPLDATEAPPIALRLHNTNILTWYPDGRIVYQSGGWRTVTTKARMNEYGPLSIWTEAGIWYVGPSWDKDAIRAVYAEGIVSHLDGTITGASTDNGHAEKLLRSRIRKFTHEYVEALITGGVPAPGAGDCFYCQMRTEDGTSKTADHILSHMDESYFVPSLMLRACELAGMRPEWWLAWVWGPQAETPGHRHEAQRNAPQYRRALRRYICGELGLVK